MHTCIRAFTIKQTVTCTYTHVWLHMHSSTLTYTRAYARTHINSYACIHAQWHTYAYTKISISIADCQYTVSAASALASVRDTTEYNIHFLEMWVTGLTKIGKRIILFFLERFCVNCGETKWLMIAKLLPNTSNQNRAQ